MMRRVVEKTPSCSPLEVGGECKPLATSTDSSCSQATATDATTVSSERSSTTTNESNNNNNNNNLSASISTSVNTDQLYKIPLIPVNCSFGIVTTKEYDTLSLQQMLRKERKAKGGDVTVLFAVRTPGCVGCREHGLQLSELAKTDANVNLVGIVKETGVADDELLEFYQDYFRYPLYKDDKWKLYHAMGGRQLSWFGVLVKAVSLTRRVNAKGIKKASAKGDFWTYGGVMVFDQNGLLRFTHHEVFGVEFDMDAIGAAISDARSTK